MKNKRGTDERGAGSGYVLYYRFFGICTNLFNLRTKYGN